MPDQKSISVVLPMLTLVPGGMGGSETYARELCRQLGVRPDVHLTSVVSRHGRGFAGSGSEFVAERVTGGHSNPARVRALVTGALPDRRLRRLMSAADVVHYPLTVPLPGAGQTPMVQTILDMQHRDLPDLFSFPEVAYRRMAYERPARRANRVITISHFSKQRIVARLGIDPERIRVAHLGVDAGTFEPHHGRREPFVLYPARAWPHKNHQRLIAAIARLRETRPNIRLVLTGGGRTDLGILPDWAEHRGLVSEDELKSLYRAAACLAFPSLYEGFGLPPLEAMASGCPVAAAATGSLPEICGDAAVMFDPTDLEGMASAIGTAIDARERLVPLGLDRVKRFTWTACADAHVEVYRELAR